MGAFSENNFKEISKDTIITRNKSKMFFRTQNSKSLLNTNQNNYTFRETDTRLKKIKDQQKRNQISHKFLTLSKSNKDNKTSEVRSLKRKTTDSVFEKDIPKIKAKKINSNTNPTKINSEKLDVFEFKEEIEDDFSKSNFRKRIFQSVYLNQTNNFFNENRKNGKYRFSRKDTGNLKIGTNSQGETATDFDDSSHSCESVNFMIDNLSSDQN